jgi:hypothetical protein
MEAIMHRVKMMVKEEVFSVQTYLESGRQTSRLPLLGKAVVPRERQTRRLPAAELCIG